MSDKIKVALVGAGNIANAHIDAYGKVADAEVYAICDIDPVRLNMTGDKYHIERRFTSEEEMLKALPEIDAVDVCVWNCNHASCTIMALEAGKPVLCEKPMAYSAKEAEEMKAAADKAGKLLMIGFVLRFSDEATIMQDLIAKDYLGDMYYSRAQYVRRHGNPGGWFSDKARSGGGPVIDLGVHVIDLLRFLMGNHKPVSVYAATYDKMGKRDYLKNDVGWKPYGASEKDVCDVEDLASAIIRYDNGAVTQLECAYDINGEDIAHREIIGTKAGVDFSNGVKVRTTYNDFLADVNVDLSNYKLGGDMFVREMAHFIDCVKNGTPCMAKAEDGVEIMKILDAIYESGRTGHEVVIQ